MRLYRQSRGQSRLAAGCPHSWFGSDTNIWLQCAPASMRVTTLRTIQPPGTHRRADATEAEPATSMIGSHLISAMLDVLIDAPQEDREGALGGYRRWRWYVYLGGVPDTRRQPAPGHRMPLGFSGANDEGHQVADRIMSVPGGGTAWASSHRRFAGPPAFRNYSVTDDVMS
jgi:hypothetical protein